jgi:hypothetical protein
MSKSHYDISSRFLIVGLWTIVAISIIFLLLMISKSGIDCKTNKACFIEAANKCKTAVLKDSINNTIVEYITTSNCELIKKIKSFSKDEPAEAVALLKDKDMRCSYKKGDFNANLIEGLTAGITDCKGPLKEVIYELKIARYILES